MPVVMIPLAHTPPPHMDADDLPPLQDGMVLMDVTSDEQTQMTHQKLRDSLSFSHTGGSLSTEFSKIKPDEDLLSKSCFSQIRLDKGGDDFDDDELTSLDWLQDGNLLKNINEKAGVCLSPPSSDEECEYDSGKENDSLNSSFTSHGMSPLPHPSHIPYNPQKHINSKPPYSFSCLIFMAIEESFEKKLPVKDIYTWILTNFPYFQNAPTGWKNSVRHNLSLNKCFQKVDKDKTSNIGKGSYWCIDPEYRPTLLQALRKTPYHPYHQLQMMSVSPLHMTPQKLPFVNRFGYGNKSISPHLFPFLSKRLHNAQAAMLDTDIDVAKALVSLKKSRSGRIGSKHNNKLRSLHTGKDRSRSPSPPEFGSTEDRSRTTNRTRRANSPIIVTEVPSTDHTYSACNVPKGLMGSPASSSIDGEYEFNDVDEGDGLLSGDEFDSEEEEEMTLEQVDNGKEMDGVNALLNLASIATSAMSDLLPEEELEDSEPQKPQIVDPPVTDKLAAADIPVDNTPADNVPDSDLPVAEEPVPEKLVADEPVADEPVADEPVADEPVTDAPITIAPAVKAPVVRTPPMTTRSSRPSPQSIRRSSRVKRSTRKVRRLSPTL